MQRSPRDERVLYRADKISELWGEAQRQDFGKDFGDQVNEADRPIVAQAGRVRMLRQQCQQRLIQLAEPTPSVLFQHIIVHFIKICTVMISIWYLAGITQTLLA